MKKIYLLFYIFLSACAFRIEDDETLRKQAANEILETLVKSTGSERVVQDDIHIRLVDDKDFNKFQLIINWPSRAYRAEIKIDDEIIESSEDHFIRTNIDGRNDPLNVTITLFNELGAVLGSKHDKTRFLKDILIDQYVTYKDILEVNRLLFTTGGRITTDGHDLTIKAKKIIIEDTYNPGAAFRPEDAHILTMVPGTKASTTEGKPTHARIKIEAKEAIGDLRVALVGFDGNDGVTPIVEHPPGRAGKDGTPGEALDVGKYCIDDRGRPCRVEIACKVEPQAAKPGEPGATGADATNGQDGGDSGDLIVDVKESKLFTVQVQAMPGLGGHPGLPGEGGPGGPAGKTPVAAKGCKQPPTASQGSKGPDGKKGKAGNGGIIGFIEAKGAKLQILERAATQ